MNKKVSLTLIIALVGFPQISETIYTPALPDVAQSLQSNATSVEQTLSIYFIGFAFGVLLWGAISDRIGRKLTALIGLLIYGLSTFFCGHSHSVENLLLWRFFQAFGASIGSVITMTIIRDVFHGAEKVKLFSLISAALAFSPAIGPLAGGWITQLFGWRANFTCLCIFAMVLFIWTLLQLAETRPGNTTRVSFKNVMCLGQEMFSSTILCGHVLLIGATNAIIFGFYQEAPFVFIEQMGMSPGWYGLFGVLIAIATIFSARYGYAKTHVCSHEVIIHTGMLSVFIGSGLYMLVTLSGILHDIGFGLAIACISLFIIFFGIGLIIPNSISHSLKAYQRMAGTAGSLFGFAYYCMIAACTFILSMMSNGTVFSLPLYMLCLSGILAGGTYLIKNKTAQCSTYP